MVDLQIATIKALARLMIEHPNLPESVEMIIEELMLVEMKQLVEARNPERSYAMLARQVIDESMKEFDELGLAGHFDDSPR